MASTSDTAGRFQASIWPSICKIPTASLLALQTDHVLPDWSNPHARLWQHESLQGLECYYLLHDIHLLCRKHHKDLRCKPRVEQDRDWCTSISSSRFYSVHDESEQDQQYVLMHWETALPNDVAMYLCTVRFEASYSVKYILLTVLMAMQAIDHCQWTGRVHYVDDSFMAVCSRKVSLATLLCLAFKLAFQETSALLGPSPCLTLGKGIAFWSELIKLDKQALIAKFLF